MLFDRFQLNDVRLAAKRLERCGFLHHGIFGVDNFDGGALFLALLTIVCLEDFGLPTSPQLLLNNKLRLIVTISVVFLVKRSGRFDLYHITN